MSAITPEMLFSGAISQREKLLYLGNREVTRYGPFCVTLYWEPHFENASGTGEQVLRKSFTIDLELNGRSVEGLGYSSEGVTRRYRLATLKEADIQLADIEGKLLIELGKIAFRLN